VAVLIAVLGTPREAEILGSFRAGWEVMAGLAFASAIAAAGIGRLSAAPVQVRPIELEQAV
jgi:hypothetical protein